MKLSSTQILNLHMNIIVKCSTKWVEMCSAMLLCKHLSHVFPAVCKIQSFSTLPNSKWFKTWRCRKNCGRGLIRCLSHGFAFSRQLEAYVMSSNAAALRTQNDHRMTSKQRTDAPRAFESLSRYYDVIRWPSAWCCSKMNTHFYFTLC